MKRSILSGAAGGALFVCSVLVGCGSSTGDGTPRQLPEPPAPGRPATNPDDPVVNANQPATNPDAPGASTTGSGTVNTGGGQGTGGRGGDNPPPPGGGKGCGDGCASLQACSSSCASFCAAFAQMAQGNCGSQAAAVKACVDRAGIMCDGTKIAVVGGACEAEGTAYLDCLSPPGQTQTSGM